MIYLFMIIGLLLHSTMTNGTSFGSNTSKDLKQPVNFSGKLSTHQGQEYIVDNISINSLYKQIPMYDKPTLQIERALNPDTNQKEIKLEADPADDITKIDLSELNQIQVPSPETIWYYEKKGRKQEFIEVMVITKSDTKRSYLLDPRTPIYCDEIDAAGPQEKTVRLAAVKTLTIEGYTYRDNSKTPKECPTCPPCSTEKDK